jgi:hypothetical protein
MARKKVIKINKDLEKGTKKTNSKPSSDENEEKDADAPMLENKTKKPAEVDVADILPEVDEKVDPESPLEVDEEEEEDMPSLDSEDVNPFGDKWEE